VRLVLLAKLLSTDLRVDHTEQVTGIASVLWSRDHGLETRVHSSSFCPGLGLGLETWSSRSRSWSRDLKKGLDNNTELHIWNWSGILDLGSGRNAKTWHTLVCLLCWVYYNLIPWQFPHASLSVRLTRLPVVSHVCVCVTQERLARKQFDKDLINWTMVLNLEARSTMSYRPSCQSDCQGRPPGNRRRSRVFLVREYPAFSRNKVERLRILWPTMRNAIAFLSWVNA